MIPSPQSDNRTVSKILIIEDDDFYFESLQRHFKRLGAHVFHAMSLQAANVALDEIENDARQPFFDLIVVDLGLPDFGSKKEDDATRLMILDRIISRSSSSVHLVITGRFSNREAEQCRLIGAKGYLGKSRLNGPTLASLLDQMASSDFIIHSGKDVANTVTIGNPVLSLSEEECLQWVEQRPAFMKRKDCFSLMARHFGFKSPDIAEQKYKRARSKVISANQRQSCASDKTK